MKHRKAFRLSFFLGILAFSAPYGAALYAMTPAPQPQELRQKAAVQADPTTFLLCAAKRGEAPGCFLLLRTQPEQARIAFAVLPGETMAQDKDGFDSLALIWKKYGGRRAADALSDTLEVAVDRYLTVPQASLPPVLDQLGSIDFTPTQENAVLSAGRQVLDGSRICALAFSHAYPGGEEERREMIGVLAREILLQRAALLRAGELERLYLLAVNAGENDLTAADYELRRDALLGLLQGGPDVVWVAVRGRGNDAGNTFLLSSDTVQELKEYFAEI